MATYIVMFSLTEQGMQNVKDSPSPIIREWRRPR